MGSQHLLTFDGQTLSFRGSCDYLLARDFVNENFTLIMRATNSTNKGQFLLTHIMPDYSLTIDIFNDVSSIPRRANRQGLFLTLPSLLTTRFYIHFVLWYSLLHLLSPSLSGPNSLHSIYVHVLKISASDPSKW